MGSSRPHISAQLGVGLGRADRLEDIMSEPGLVDITGRVRSPAATPGHWAGYAPPNKGGALPGRSADGRGDHLVMREAGRGQYGDRLRGLIAMLGVPGCGSARALALTETDLDRRPGRCWCARARAESDGWSGWTSGAGSNVARWTEHGSSYRSARCSASSPGRREARAGQPPPREVQRRRLAAEAGVRRRFAPHQLRHAHAVEMSGTQP